MCKAKPNEVSEPEALRQKVCDSVAKQTTLPKWNKNQDSARRAGSKLGSNIISQSNFEAAAAAEPEGATTRPSAKNKTKKRLQNAVSFLLP